MTMLADKLKKLLQPYIEAGGLHVDVGILEGATGSGETNNENMPMAALGAIHEFGTTTIPPRPFMRLTVEKKQKDWGKLAGVYLQAHRGDVRGALEMIGEAASKDMQATIEKGVSPALAKSTIAAKRRRGKSNPAQALVDTGAMQESISFEVRQ